MLTRFSPVVCDEMYEYLNEHQHKRRESQYLLSWLYNPAPNKIFVAKTNFWKQLKREDLFQLIDFHRSGQLNLHSKLRSMTLIVFQIH